MKLIEISDSFHVQSDCITKIERRGDNICVSTTDGPVAYIYTRKYKESITDAMYRLIEEVNAANGD